MATKVTIGTRFRKIMTDSNPLWEVVSITGQHATVVAVNEPIEHDGRTFDSEYAGVQQSVLLTEVRSAVDFEKMINEHSKKTDEFWENQVNGNVLHYHHSFGQFIRGEVVTVAGKKELKATALVGAWKAYDLPTRQRDGKIHYPYNARKVLNGDSWTPDQSLVFESPTYGERLARHGDPTTMKPLDLSLEEPSGAEKIAHSQESVIRAVIANLQDPSVAVEARLKAAIDALSAAL